MNQMAMKQFTRIYFLFKRQQNEQKTCPMCRQAFSDQDEYWEMTDLPDKDEMHKYVVSLASGIPSVMMTS